MYLLLLKYKYYDEPTHMEETMETTIANIVVHDTIEMRGCLQWNESNLRFYSHN
jgi:hypothetical protein